MISNARPTKNRSLTVAALIGWAVPASGATVFAQSGGGYVIIKSTIDGGGMSFHTDGQPGGYRLAGTVGQHDASGPLTDGGGAYRLTGGFWRGIPQPFTTGDDACIGGAGAGAPCGQNSDCPGGLCQSKNRFISATLPATASGHGVKVNLVVIDVNSAATPSNYNGTDRWAGAAAIAIGDGVSPPFNAAKVQCAFASQDWSGIGLIHLYGDVMVPQSSYDVSVCSSEAGPCSAALRVDTAKWGDIIAPLGVTNFQDITSIVAKFQGSPSGPSKTRTKLAEPVNPVTTVNFQEISADVAAFQGKAYKQAFPTPPATCP